jgi:hypothetical protein
MFSCFQHIHSHVFLRKIEDWQATKFVQQHDMFAVGNGHTGKDDSYTPSAAFPARIPG